jgi:hypothetical protein
VLSDRFIHVSSLLKVSMSSIAGTSPPVALLLPSELPGGSHVKHRGRGLHGSNVTRFSLK